jgi:hypothetical protein
MAATGENRGRVWRIIRLNGTNRIHAAINGTQPTHPDTMVDRVAAHASGQQLGATDHAVGSGQGQDPPLNRESRR